MQTAMVFRACLSLRWERTTLPLADVEFPRFGQCELPCEEVKAALEQFIGQIAGRLASRQLTDTLLQREFIQMNAELSKSGSSTTAGASSRDSRCSSVRPARCLAL